MRRKRAQDEAHAEGEDEAREGAAKAQEGMGYVDLGMGCVSIGAQVGLKTRPKEGQEKAQE